MKVLILAVSLWSAGALAGAPSQSPNKPLTKAEAALRLALLEDSYKDFLTDVEPIITNEEKTAYLLLETNPQRDLFIDDFWQRRDRMQGTTNSSFRKEYYERLDYVKDNFERVASDRAKMYLILGEPAQVVDINCPQAMRPAQAWFYGPIPNHPEMGREMAFLFFKPEWSKEFKLWDPDDRTNQIFRADPIFRGPGGHGSSIEMCRNVDALRAAMKKMFERRTEVHEVYLPPKIDPETASHITSSVVIPNPSAPKIDPKVNVAFVASEGLRTDVQMAIDIPRSQIQPADLANVKVYTIDVIGEVIRESRMWETFRYRFDFPFETPGETLPLVIDRILRTGSYTTRVRIVDATSGAEAYIERSFDVPTAPKAAATEASNRIDSLQHSLIDPNALIRIVPFDQDIVSGVRKIETLLSGNARGVEWWLDGRKVAVRHAPPYTLDLDFGNVPQTHKIRVIAIDEKDQPIAGDEISVNTGTDPFRVRILSPRVAPHAKGATRVVVDVKTPRRGMLQSLELYYNDQRIATLFNPPFVQVINIPSADQIGFIKAVATMNDDAHSQTEDVVIVNSPAQMEEVNVHLVELPTTVLANGKPRLGLPQSAFHVFDETKHVNVTRFEEVKNLALSVGVAVDNSESMQPRMAEAQSAAAQFLKTVMRGGDKAFVVGFDNTPRVMQAWSASATDLVGALTKMRARDGTALYDAVVYSLYNFVGVRGQRALVVITDGKDTSSKFSYEQMLEYARRSGVPIYTIGVGIRTLDLETRMPLNRLCTETGGTAYFIGSAKELASTYTTIAEELRSQYILGFYPDDKNGTKWHSVSVEVEGGKARTIHGYYP